MDAVWTWLMEGDAAIRYQAKRDLCGDDDPQLRRSILTEGWGKRFMDCRNADGSWGRGFYRPKWTSTHYTLLDLKNMAAPPDAKLLRASVDDILKGCKAADGGIGTSLSRAESDVCVNGMVMNYACYFSADENALKSVVDFLIANRMNDGGFNCESNRSPGVRHSSLHTTLSVLEGLYEYRRNGYFYRLDELAEIEHRAIAFILMHRLFLSDRSGEIIDPKFLRFTWPFRWKYTILRAMDHFRSIDLPYDPRMDGAVNRIRGKRGRDGRWKLQSKFSGAEHFAMEAPGEPSRWITLLALRILKYADTKSS